MPTDYSRLRAAILAHYDQHRRDLPWRAESDPYRILVSEVMLQQTRVETVLEYYEEWLRCFPNMETLAAASEAEVLKAWEGLGYYRRARNLQRAVRMVCDRFDGSVPTTVEGLRELPGVGEYTAGAVASIAFDVPSAAVDGNVRRVLARWYDVADPSDAWLRRAAADLVDPDRPGDWNQALMELGATVCTPRTPKCGACPVAWTCAARAAGTVDDRPAPKGKRAPRPTTFALAVVRATDGSVLLERRPEGGLLGGMWAFPEREVIDPVEARAAATAIARALSFESSPDAWRALPSVRHRFTHIDATYLPWLLDLDISPSLPGRAPTCWAGRDERETLALPVAQRAVLESV